MTIGFFGRQRRLIFDKLGHRVGRSTIVRAASGSENARSMVVVLGEMIRGMILTSPLGASVHAKVSRKGNKGPSDGRTNNICEDKVAPRSLRIRILSAYLRKRPHSDTVGDLLKDYQIKRLREGKMDVVATLTVDSLASQTSSPKDLSNGRSRSWVIHNTSNTGSVKLWQQHTGATVVALASDSTSPRAMSSIIPPTSTRPMSIKEYVRPKKCFQPYTDIAKKNHSRPAHGRGGAAASM